MKRLVYLVAVGIMLAGMLFLFTACGGGDKSEEAKLVCGITEYEPMNYKDTNGEWTGFDTEFASMVGQKLGMTVEYQQIVWENKYSELDSGSIDCIWNGFTANASDDGVPRSEMVDLSYAYMLNQQCVVIKASRDSEFTTEDSLVGKTAAAEKGSAGEGYAVVAVGSAGKVIDAAAQTGTLLEVKSGAVDFAVVDILLAKKMTGAGDYSDLKIADITLDSEVYAVAFKKGSEFTDKINQAMLELYEDGSLVTLAEKYGLENSLIMETSAEAVAEEVAAIEDAAEAADVSEGEADEAYGAAAGTEVETTTVTEVETETEAADDAGVDVQNDAEADTGA